MVGCLSEVSDESLPETISGAGQPLSYVGATFQTELTGHYLVAESAGGGDSK